MANNNKMTIIEALVQLRNDLKLWVANNLRVKLNKNLGKEENANKILATDSEGNVITIDQNDVSIDIDSALSETSQNPVQNKVVTSALSNKLDSGHNVDANAHEDIRNAIPKDMGDLQDDENHRTVTDAEKEDWNNKVDQDQGTNNAGKVLLVDINGKVVAGNPTIEGAVDAASRLSTPRTISLDGNVTGSTMFDGSKDVTITTEIETIIDSEIDEIFEGTFYSISYNLSDSSSSFVEEEIYNNEKFVTTITPNTGYKITSVSVLMNDIDISDDVYENGIITIPSVTGNIEITIATSVLSTYTITYNLTNCSSSNTETTIIEGSSYNSSISCASNYAISEYDVTMEGGGEKNITQTGGRKITINIPEVTGNIIITAIADN